MQDFVAIHGGFKFNRNDLYTIKSQITSVIKGAEYVDIVDPMNRSGTLDFDAFGDTCVGSHTITVRFNDKKKYTSNEFREMAGGGMGTAFVFLIAVPGKELKKPSPETSRKLFKEAKNTKVSNPRGRQTSKKGSGGGKRTLKRNRK
jgi:hypothetical protein